MESQHNQQDREKRSPRNDRTFGSLIRELMLEIMSLIRNETALARAEISENISKLQGGIIALVLSVVLLLVGLIGLMDAGIYGLGHVWPMWLSALVIGGAITVVGLIALAIGVRTLKARNLTLDRTADELRKEAEFARRQAQ